MSGAVTIDKGADSKQNLCQELAWHGEEEERVLERTVMRWRARAPPAAEREEMLAIAWYGERKDSEAEEVCERT
jgi:hypothetical protein